ncbi:MAG: hypothetical protein ACKODX_00845 [Gemmata sp.]
MTEAEWLQSAQVQNLKKHLGCPLSTRKCLLTLCAYARHIAPHVVVPRVMEIVAEFEAGADREPRITLNLTDCFAMQEELLGHLTQNSPEWSIAYLILHSLHSASERGYLGIGAFEGISHQVALVTHPTAHHNYNRRNLNPKAVETHLHENAIRIEFTRDIFGNPFRPVAFSPSWRTDTAVALARQMYESRDFSAMPILADALQDAECDSEQILSHCRDEGRRHVRGCWVVDLVLGME